MKKFYHCRIAPCPHGLDKYRKCMSQTDDFQNGCPKVKCKLCGFLHNGSKEAIEYHSGRCVEDRKAQLRDPFCLGERSLENRKPFKDR